MQTLRWRMRRLKTHLLRWLRHLVFFHCWRRLKNDTAGLPSAWVLRGLIFGWGNPAWSAQIEYLQEVIKQLRAWHLTTVECGSDLSTLVVAAIGRHFGCQHVALEHDECRCLTVRRAAASLGLDNLRVVHAPLRDFGAYAWYDVDPDSLPTEVALVICDGPRGNTKGGRYGVLPVLFERLFPGALILIDDARRPGEQDVIQRWTGEFGAVASSIDARKPFARVQVPHSTFRRGSDEPLSAQGGSAQVARGALRVRTARAKARAAAP